MIWFRQFDLRHIVLLWQQAYEQLSCVGCHGLCTVDSCGEYIVYAWDKNVSKIYCLYADK